MIRIQKEKLKLSKNILTAGSESKFTAEDLKLLLFDNDFNTEDEE